jgi:general secretion pathway protein G
MGNRAAAVAPTRGSGFFHSSFPIPYSPRQLRGFTLIELLVVLAIVGTLLMLAVPRYFSSVDRSKEAVLKENLFQLRDAIGKYYADKGRYPESVETLASEKYLRRVPMDPITDSAATWVVVPPEDMQKGGVYDVKSGAQGNAKDGTAYGEW